MDCMDVCDVCMSSGMNACIASIHPFIIIYHVWMRRAYGEMDACMGLCTRLSECIETQICTYPNPAVCMGVRHTHLWAYHIILI